jgi:hypothetical protein
MTRSSLAILSLVLVAGCFESHGGQQALTQDDCSSCHMKDYNATGTADPYLNAPNHQDPGVGFPTTCADCHRNTSWQPALGGLHPQPNKYVNATGGNDTFLISKGAHVGIKCLACHDLDIPADTTPPSRGFNTDCIQCHPNNAAQQQAHPTGTMSPAGNPYAYSDTKRNFCLTCHPTGEAAGHPEDKFPISASGHHRGIKCADCHIRSTGPDAKGANTNCVNCHNPGHDSDDAPNYGAYKTNPPNPGPFGAPLTKVNYCLASGCHSDGKKHGD